MSRRTLDKLRSEAEKHYGDIEMGADAIFVGGGGISLSGGRGVLKSVGGAASSARRLSLRRQGKIPRWNTPILEDHLFLLNFIFVPEKSSQKFQCNAGKIYIPFSKV